MQRVGIGGKFETFENLNLSCHELHGELTPAFSQVSILKNCLFQFFQHSLRLIDSNYQFIIINYTFGELSFYDVRNPNSEGDSRVATGKSYCEFLEILARTSSSSRDRHSDLINYVCLLLVLIIHLFTHALCPFHLWAMQIDRESSNSQLIYAKKHGK